MKKLIKYIGSEKRLRATSKRIAIAQYRPVVVLEEWSGKRWIKRDIVQGLRICRNRDLTAITGALSAVDEARHLLNAI